MGDTAVTCHPRDEMTVQMSLPRIVRRTRSVKKYLTRFDE